MSLTRDSSGRRSTSSSICSNVGTCREHTFYLSHRGAVVVTLDARFVQVLRGMHVEVFYPGGHDLVS